MSTLFYVRLVGLTAGTLLQLFWIVLILGYRRPRSFERMLFFVGLALFLFYSGSLLALNAEIYYPVPPPALLSLAVTLVAAGLGFLPPLIVHVHAAYARATEEEAAPKWLGWLVGAAYLPVLYFAILVYPRLLESAESSLVWPGRSLGAPYGVWLAASMLVGAYFERRFARQTSAPMERQFHRTLQVFLLVAAPFALAAYVIVGPRSVGPSPALGTSLMLASLLPSALLAYFVLRYNFLQIGRQRNLVYAVSAAFLALLYLGAVRRVSTWLEHLLPPEATAAILLFTLVIFFEPLQRRVAGLLHERFQKQVDQLQKLMAEIQQEARNGDSARLAEFIERRICQAFGLAGVRLRLRDVPASSERPDGSRTTPQAAWSYSPRTFTLRDGEREIGTLEAAPHGAALSGESRGALEFLAEQLPAVLDLCRLMEQKLALERELAERERLALVGQMAASISHNLKNPLGSMKTILQVQLENPQLPASFRKDCELVIAEIDRLGIKLGQLLRFSKPALRTGAGGQQTDGRAVTERIVGLLRHDAERRGVRLTFEAAGEEFGVRASEEALSDVLSNLLVNAIEALGSGGRVGVRLARQNGALCLTVEDDGPGVPTELQKKIFQPFFTTKSHGTGLGLAIVARRVAEMGGEIHWKSPAKDNRGTEFRVLLPLEEGTGSRTPQGESR
jgi:signal transduction histidine kinase